MWFKTVSLLIKWHGDFLYKIKPYASILNITAHMWVWSRRTKTKSMFRWVSSIIIRKLKKTMKYLKEHSEPSKHTAVNVKNEGVSMNRCFEHTWLNGFGLLKFNYYYSYSKQTWRVELKGTGYRGISPSCYSCLSRVSCLCGQMRAWTPEGRVTYIHFHLGPPAADNEWIKKARYLNFPLMSCLPLSPWATPLAPEYNS